MDWKKMILKVKFELPIIKKTKTGGWIDGAAVLYMQVS